MELFNYLDPNGLSLKTGLRAPLAPLQETEHFCRW
jgi:hypothetical protein